MDLALASLYHTAVALYHGWHLLALVRMDDKNDFVMTHVNSSWIFRKEKPPVRAMLRLIVTD
jgi:hypothetical protein